MADAAVSSRGISRGALVRFAVGGIVIAVLAVVITGFAVNNAATQREAQLADRLSKAGGRVQQLGASFAQSESRLRRTETVVAAQKSKEAALDAERRELASSPGNYIQTVSVAIFDKGLVNAYSRATSATLTNHSHFNLSDLRGVIEYRRADGSLVGSAPIEVQGPILAGQTATRQVVANEVSGASSPQQSRVVVQSAVILEGTN